VWEAAHDVSAAPAAASPRRSTLWPAAAVADIAILIPVLGRPERVTPLLDSLGRTETWTVRPVFIASPEDSSQLVELEASGFAYLVAGWRSGPGDYARKINLAIRETREPWVFTGADDLCFCHDWAVEALAVHAQTQARVIGTNDLGNSQVQSGMFGTHCIVRRDYAELGTIDGQPGLLHEGYDHNFVDRELADTARYREAWAYAERSMVEHLHPHWGLAELDATYQKGQARFREDAALYQSRVKLWSYR
jgi:hypothetical protein